VSPALSGFARNEHRADGSLAHRLGSYAVPVLGDRVRQVAFAVRRHRFARALKARRALISVAPPAPPTPAGWHTGPPDFVGVGFMKAGTTWWHRLIAAHPQVAQIRGRAKELHYFDRYCNADFSEADIARYTGYFPRPAGSLAGEWTPRYATDFWTPALLRLAAPDAKLIVLLRDPVERYRSGLAHEMARGAMLRPHVAQDHFGRGLYDAALDRLHRHFDPGQVLVLQYERCVRAPLPALARTYEFLGLDDCGFVPETVRDEINKTASEKPRLPEALRTALCEGYQDDVRRLAARIPDLDLGLWPNFAG